MGQVDILKRSERLSTVRGVFLFALAVSVLGIGATFVGQHMLQDRFTSTDIQDMRHLFQVVWFISMIGISAVNMRINNSAVLKDLINDERARIQRLRAFAIAFWVFLITTVAALLTAIFIDLDLKSTLLMVLCIGGSAPALAQAFVSLKQ